MCGCELLFQACTLKYMTVPMHTSPTIWRHSPVCSACTCCVLDELAAWHRLTGVPDGIGQLVHLQRLCLSHNAIAALPACMSQLTILQQLDLRNNSLKELPQVRNPAHVCCYDSLLCTATP